MARGKVFFAANLKIKCDERCPLYYCSDPCRVREHAKRYTAIIKMGYECSEFKRESDV